MFSLQMHLRILISAISNTLPVVVRVYWETIRAMWRVTIGKFLAHSKSVERYLLTIAVFVILKKIRISLFTFWVLAKPNLSPDTIQAVVTLFIRF